MKTNRIIRNLTWCPLLAFLTVSMTSSSWAAAEARAATTSTSAKDGQTFDFQQKWVVGKRYLQRQEMNQETEMAIPQMPSPMKQTMKNTQDFAVSVLAVRPTGGWELNFEFVAQKMEMSMGGQTMMSYDSTQPASAASNPMLGALGKMVGVKMKMLTDAKGKVESVEGLKEVIEKLAGDAGGPMQDVIKGVLNEDNLKEMGELGNCLPNKTIRLGEQWNLQREFNLGQMGAMKVSMTITFSGWEERDQHRCALFETTGTVTGASEGKMGPMTFKMENGKTSGKVWFDPELGMTRGAVQVQTMNLKIMPPQGDPITGKIQQNVNSKLVEMTDIK
jgi:hypothetical protein